MILAALFLHLVVAAYSLALLRRLPAYLPIAALLSLGAASEVLRFALEAGGRAGLGLYLVGPLLGVPVAAIVFRAPRWVALGAGALLPLVLLFLAGAPAPELWWRPLDLGAAGASAVVQVMLGLRYLLRGEPLGPAQRAALLLAACDAAGVAGRLAGGIPWQASACWILLLGLQARELLRIPAREGS